jgi:amino acid adenylation domain-containing protein/non-ribosomal peptide synthase protein (TIGR01720 family)
MQLNETNIRDLVREARSHGVHFTTDGQSLQLRMDERNVPGETLLAALRAHKPDIIRFLQSERPQPRVAELPLLPRDPLQHPLPASFAQERLWLIDSLEGSIAYHVPTVLRLTGPLNQTAFEQALQSIVDRHEVLRTRLVEAEGEVRQHIDEAGRWKLDHWEENQPPTSSDIEAYVAHPFDLARDPMMRVLLASISEDEHLAVAVLHHIASDGWSRSVLVRELKEGYVRFDAGSGDAPAYLSIQYADYAIWQRNELKDAALDRLSAYWTNQLTGVQPLALPLDFPRPAMRSGKGRTRSFFIDAETANSLNLLARSEGMTLYMVLMTGLQLLLNRYSGQRDICIGMPIANRVRPELEAMIGFFVNTLAIRQDIDPEQTLGELFTQVKANITAAYEHQDLPFEKVVELVGGEREPSVTPLFQVLMVLQNQPEIPELALGPVRLRVEEFEHATSKFDLSFDFRPEGSGLRLRVEYDTELFHEETIDRMTQHLLTLLQQLPESIHLRAGQVPMIPAGEYHRTVVEANETKRTYGQAAVIDLFERQAAMQPDAIALTQDTRTMTYSELNGYANAIATQLLEHGVGPEVYVPVCLDRSFDLIASILAVLKTGASYVPIDPAYPSERIALMLDDVRASVILCNAATAAVLPISGERLMVGPDVTFVAGNPAREGMPADRTTYVIYTSGSTGKPKGILMPDSALYNLLCWQVETIPPDTERRILQFASINFDASFQEIFLALGYGGRLCLIDEAGRRDLPRLFEVMEAGSVTHLFIPFVVLKNICAYASDQGSYPASIREIFTAGEQLRLSPDIREFLEQTGAVLYNYYGPSETHVVTSYKVQLSDFDRRVLPPIGLPIANTTTYILDAFGAPCCIGQVGELYLGGVQVANGYLNRPELTAERFLPDPFSPGNKMYRTGDLCRWLPDGNIEFLGRSDDQVKIRGYRVELGEVEAELSSAPGVRQCVVIAVDDGNGSKKLVGYCVGGDEFDEDTVRDDLQRRLPSFMIPAHFVRILEIPYTNNGKVDKKRLPAPTPGTTQHGGRLLPLTPLEKELAQLWAALLRIDEAGVTESFFRLGGHSLLVTRLLSQVRKHYGTAVSVRSFFQTPTIRFLAAQISNQSAPLAQQAAERPELLPLSFAQERFWLIDQLEGSNHYHLTCALRVRGELDIDALSRAFGRLVTRHEVLRTCYHATESNGVVQQVRPAGEFHPEIINDDAVEPLTMVAHFCNRAFKLDTDLPIRVAYISSVPGEKIVAIVVHHIAADGWSLNLLFRELSEAYAAETTQQDLTWSETVPQYADFALQQRTFWTRDRIEAEQQYWKLQLANLEPAPLIADRANTGENTGALAELQLGRELAEPILLFSRSTGVSPFSTLLSAFKVLLYQYTAQPDASVGTSLVNRSEKDGEEGVGLYLNTAVLRTQVDPHESFSLLVSRVAQMVNDALEHGELPFEKVVEALGLVRSLDQNPLFGVMFEQAVAPNPEDICLGSSSVEPLTLPRQRAKFDLLWTVQIGENNIQLAVEFNAAIYDSATVARMLDAYKMLLSKFMEKPHLQVGKAACLLPGEEAVLDGFNPKPDPRMEEETFLSLWKQQVEKHPERIAMEEGGQTITYAGLWQRASSIAAALDVEAEELVPIAMRRGIELAAAVIAVWMRGAAYVAVDTDQPLVRLRNLLSETKARIILIDSSFVHARDLSEKINFVSTAEIPTTAPALLPGVDVKPGTLAYVLYTSGSTGLPKGAMIEHGGLLNHLFCKIEDLGLNAGDRIAQTASFTFDISVWQMFSALLTGGATVFYSKEEWLHTATFLHRLSKDSIFILELVPSFLNALLEEQAADLPGLRYLLVTGETVLQATLQSWFTSYPGVPVVNAYGPTEASDDITHHVMTTLPEGPVVPIGKPVRNTRIYIVDPAGRRCPPGIVGEIWVAGAGVGRGYWNDDVRTAESFCTDPFLPGNHRLYRTGDLGRWTRDGLIEFFGRKDEQVKINGYRIELGEVENSLLQLHGVRQAAVVLAGAERKALVAFVCTDVEPEELQDQLRQSLPHYLVPQVLHRLDTLPTLPSGKVDRRSLQQFSLPAASSKSAAPMSEAEAILSELWKELLNISEVGVHDNFFTVGGDSILAIQLVIRSRRKGLFLQLRDIFQHQTIAELARHTHADGLADNTDAAASEGLLPIQSFFFEQQLAQPSHYNQAVLLEVDKSLPVELLQQGWMELVRRHAALRTRFSFRDGQWVPVSSSSEGMLEELLLEPSDGETIAAAIETVGRQVQESLNLEEGPVYRAVLLRTPDDQRSHRLLLVLHHLLVDAVSWRVLLEEMEQYIQGKQAGDVSFAMQPTASTAQWREALRTWVERRFDQADWKEWSRSLAALQPLPEDEFAFGVPGQLTDTAGALLEKDETDFLLKGAHTAYSTDLQDLLLAALHQSISSWSGHSSLLLYLEGHGREQPGINVDVSQTVGWFTSIYPVVLTAPQNGEPKDWIIETKEQLRRAPFRGIAYGALRYLHPDEAARKNTDLPMPPAVLFNYLGQTDRQMSGSRWFRLATEPVGPTSAAGNRLPAPIVINASVVDQRLVINWDFDTSRFSRIVIDGMIKEFTATLRNLARHCSEARPQPTPSDFGLGSQVDWQELHGFLDSAKASPVVDMYALSPLQSGMLFHGLYDRDSRAYFLQLSCTLRNLQPDLFLAAWQDLIQRHSILRTSFLHDRFGVPVQLVHATANMPVQLLDWRNETDPERLYTEFRNKDYEIGFDFETPPLMRLALIRMGEDTYRMVWTFHHLVTDGWGLPVQMRNLFEAYSSRLSGAVAPAYTEDRYRDYIRYISNHDRGEAERFWRSYLDGLESGTLLPFVSATIDRNKGAGTYRLSELAFGEERSMRIQAFARNHQLTVNTVVQGVWSYLLSRYSNQSDVVYGVTVSGRPYDLPEAQDRVGLYINTLPLRVQVRSSETIAAFLRNLQTVQARARDYQYTPLSTIQSWQGIRGDLFDSILVFQNYPVDKALLEQSVIGVSDVSVREQNNYVLSLIAVSDQQLRITFKYNASLLDEMYIHLMQQHFDRVLEQFLDEDRTLGSLEMMSETEVLQLSESWSGAQHPAEPYLPVITRFEQQAAKSPEAIAIRYRQEAWTYAELNQNANRLAHYLRRKNIGRGTQVPLFLPRSADAICCILAIMKAGATYVPLDPDAPEARTAFVLGELEAPLILTDSASCLHLPANYQLLALDIQRQSRLWADLEDSNLPVLREDSGPAYMIYTSGSTGSPKGVLVSQGALSSYLSAALEQYASPTGSASTFLHLALTFDAAVTSVFLPLITGSQLVIGSLSGIDTFRDQNFLASAPYDFLKLTPSHLALLAAVPGEDSTPLASCLVIGGEALHEQHLRPIVQRIGHTIIFNEYGPTEATVGCCIYRFELNAGYHAEGGVIPIGRALKGNSLYVLDKEGRLAPPGATGELYIGGRQLAEGYWKRDSLTAERFLSFPHIANGERLYRSGDLCRWLPGGLLLFEGRTDGQVKLRGHRIELREVETIAAAAPGVSQAVALVKGQHSESRLLVYYTSVSGVQPEDLMDWLRTHLPEYMLPSLAVPLQELPMTAHGKIDLRALAESGPERLNESTINRAGTPIETHLVEVFETLLQIRGLGLSDNLFNVGLDSLKTIEAQSLLNKHYPNKIEIHDLFTHNTVAMIAALVTGPEPEPATELIDF